MQLGNPNSSQINSKKRANAWEGELLVTLKLKKAATPQLDGETIKIEGINKTRPQRGEKKINRSPRELPKTQKGKAAPSNERGAL